MFSSIAALSYITAALAFLVLSVLLVTKWRGRPHGLGLTIACLCTALWAIATADQTARGNALSLPTALLELLRNAGWSVFLLTLLGPFHGQKELKKGWSRFSLKLNFSPTFSPTVVPIAALYLVLLVATIYAYSTLDSSAGALSLLSGPVGGVALAVIGMLLVEQLFRNASGKERWGIKFACLGIGGLFAYDFYLYSDAMLFRQINGEIWAARGVVNALTAPLIAISASRSPQWQPGFAVSRRFLFHSAALFGSAIYLLTMAAAGYYLRFFGGSWGIIMQVAFLFGAVILLVAVLFSGAFRSWLKVFISKHFYTYNYDYREEWIRFTRALSDSGPGLGERTVQAVAEFVESPGGALWISRESGNCEPAAHWNMFSSTVVEPANSALCQFLEKKQWVVDLQEYKSDPKKYRDLSIPDWLRALAKAWLVVPLILHGRLFGFVVLAQPRSAVQLNWEVLDLLKIAGGQAASYLAQNESANALMTARQFESFNRMSTFVVHDLKNLVSQLSLLMSNAEKHKNSPEFQKDMLETIDHSVEKMKLLLHKLSRRSPIETAAPICIDRLLEQAVAMKSAFKPMPTLQILDPDLMVFANSARLERVAGHLIQNAIEATGKEGQVTIRLAKQDEFAVVEFNDSGHGMSEEFMRERLFKPFESTKSAGMGIGVFETREYVRELGGRVEVTSRPSVGTTFRIILPLHKQHTAQAILTAA
jgi:putative PEP-CTERM system histidine kinase